MKYANKIGVKNDIINSFISSNQAHNFVVYNFQIAKSIYFSGTPTILINDEMLQGDINLQLLEKKIN